MTTLAETLTKSTVKSSSSKIIITPYAIHITQYAKKYIYGYTRTKTVRKKREGYRGAEVEFKSMLKARKSLRLLVEANCDPRLFQPQCQFRPIFATLTFRENITNLREANKRFNLFIKRLNYQINTHFSYNFLEKGNYSLKYMVVPEFQKRGAVHYHCLMFNLVKFANTKEVIERIWGQGFAFTPTLKNSFHVANYISKYFTKCANDERLKGQKRYFASRNITRPQFRYEHNYNENIIDFLTTTKPDYTQSFNEGKEKITYKLYKKNPIIPFLQMPEREQYEEKKPPKQQELFKVMHSQAKN